MNISSTTITTEVSGMGPLIDPNLADTLITIFTSVAMCLSLPGVVFNGINITVFCSMGSFDSVTICFLFLSILDFFGMADLTILSFFQFCSTRGFKFTGSKNFDTYSFACATAFALLSDMTTATTTFIALQRGLAVALPFMARHLFNRSKALMFIAGSSVILTLLWLTRSIFFEFVAVPYPADNKTTVLRIVRSENYNLGFQIYILLSKMGIGITEYVIMSVCAVFIYKGMRSSMELKSSKSWGEGTKTSEPSEADSKDTENATKKDSKELMVIKQSFLVVVCQIMCATPTNIAAIVNHFDPRFNGGSDYKLTYTLITGTYTFYGINAFANFFIYYNYNTKFRVTLKTLFGGSDKN